MDKHACDHGGDRGGEGTGGELPPLLAAGPSTMTRTRRVQGPALARTDRVTIARTDGVTLGCTSAAGPEPEAGCKGQQGGKRGQDQKPQQGTAGSQSSQPQPRLRLEEKGLRHPLSRHQAQVPVETQAWVAPCLPWGRGSPTRVRGPSGQRWLQGQAEHLRCLLARCEAVGLTASWRFGTAPGEAEGRMGASGMWGQQREGEAAAGTGAVCAGHGAEEGPGMAPSGSGWQPQLQLPGGASPQPGRGWEMEERKRATARCVSPPVPEAEVLSVPLSFLVICH